MTIHPRADAAPLATLAESVVALAASFRLLIGSSARPMGDANESCAESFDANQSMCPDRLGRCGPPVRRRAKSDPTPGPAPDPRPARRPRAGAGDRPAAPP